MYLERCRCVVGGVANVLDWAYIHLSQDDGCVLIVS